MRFAVLAVELEWPVGPKKMMNIAIAGVLGLMVGVFGAFVKVREGDESEGVPFSEGFATGSFRLLECHQIKHERRLQKLTGCLGTFSANASSEK